MNIFGIPLTPGHLILGGIGIVLYDALWSWAFNDKTSSWWFERLQGLLKVGIYTGFLGFTALIAYTPWPWNLIIPFAVVASVVSIVGWLRARAKKSSSS